MVDIWNVIISWMKPSPLPLKWYFLYHPPLSVAYSSFSWVDWRDFVGFWEKVFAHSFLKIHQLKCLTIYVLKIKRHKLSSIFYGDPDLKWLAINKIMYKNKFMRLDVNQKSWWWKEYKELPRKVLSQLEMRIET